MQAVEIDSVTDSSDFLHLNYSLGASDSKVRVLVFLNDEKNVSEDDVCLSSLKENPAFDFLSDSGEDFYTVHDGKPYFN